MQGGVIPLQVACRGFVSTVTPDNLTICRPDQRETGAQRAPLPPSAFVQILWGERPRCHDAVRPAGVYYSIRG